jgi:arabinogalactan endo-1,4-beta-galactosidase
MTKQLFSVVFVISGLMLLVGCYSQTPGHTAGSSNQELFYFGADLSYINQILDHGGSYKDKGVTADPYKIFKDHNTNLVRLRLWHDPVWTKEVYGEEGTQLYNDLIDVAKAIARSRALGMQVLLDLHYSDTWADPGKQHIPGAWKEIRSINVLADSVYRYTLQTLRYLKQRDLLPELVQLGNETNCGLLYTDAMEGFPSCNVCEGKWSNAGKVFNAGIRAVREINSAATVKTKILLHVADPKHVEWWFDNITARAGVTDFDMIGFSYYPLWHTTVALDNISDRIRFFKERFKKDVIILETAYPWTTDGADNYSNQFGSSHTPLNNFPFTVDGQYDFLVKLTKEVREGGGRGLVYWEPGWITSGTRDLWGQGSSWENCALFDFNANALKGFGYMEYKYQQ